VNLSITLKMVRPAVPRHSPLAFLTQDAPDWLHLANAKRQLNPRWTDDFYLRNAVQKNTQPKLHIQFNVHNDDPEYIVLQEIVHSKYRILALAYEAFGEYDYCVALDSLTTDDIALLCVNNSFGWLHA
jgi:hypothetical protein